MRLPGFYVVFGLAAPAVDFFVENAGVADFQIGDDETCVGPFRADFDTDDDALDTAPARGPIQKFLEAVTFPSFGAASKRAFVLATRWSRRCARHSGCDNGCARPLDEELASRLASLSQQESQVLKDLISGQANKEIVREFDLSPRTVEVYRAKLMTKNQAGSISVSVRFAINAGAFPS
jgi:DNA-binding CsgD family transcriptional regulator